MRISVSRYFLQPRSKLSGRSLSGRREGALLRFEFAEHQFGYADLHPWVELGDNPLDEQLQLLSKGIVTELTNRSLALARLDESARSHSVSAFTVNAGPVPRNHFLISAGDSLEDALETGLKLGFSTFKLKLGADRDSSLARLTQIGSLFLNSPAEARERAEFERRLRLRLDFNASMTKDDILWLVAHLPKKILDLIEFVEDPVSWDQAAWQDLHFQSHLPLALDQIASQDLSQLARIDQKRDLENPAFGWLICKPAKQDPFQLAAVAKKHGARLVITSYLDHPVGQVGAALEAARLASAGFDLQTCGLVSQNAFEENDFSKALGVFAPTFSIPPGPGIGFFNAS